MSISSEKVTLHLILVFPKSIRFIFTPRVRILKLNTEFGIISAPFGAPHNWRPFGAPIFRFIFVGNFFILFFFGEKKQNSVWGPLIVRIPLIVRRAPIVRRFANYSNDAFLMYFLWKGQSYAFIMYFLVSKTYSTHYLHWLTMWKNPRSSVSRSMDHFPPLHKWWYVCRFTGNKCSKRMYLIFLKT